MVAELFNTFLYEPFYNGFLFLVKIAPGGDVGVAVIILTIIVKLVLFSLTFKHIKAQAKIKEITPELELLKEKFKDDKKKQSEEIFALYRKHGINPLSSILVLLLQIPVFLALYWVFLKSGLPNINSELLYSFIDPPSTIRLQFLGLIDLTEKSIFLGILAGSFQFVQTKLLLPTAKNSGDKKTEPSLRSDLAKTMQFQMKFMMPALIGFLAYNFGGAVALYLITSSIFSIGQEIYMKHHNQISPRQNV
jgi:YidC/Oxa1 family membrane protein insertase